MSYVQLYPTGNIPGILTTFNYISFFLLMPYMVGHFHTVTFDIDMLLKCEANHIC